MEENKIFNSFEVTDKTEVDWYFPREKVDNPKIQIRLNTTSDYFIKNREKIENFLGKEINEYWSTGTLVAEVDGKRQKYSQVILTDLKDSKDAKLIEVYLLCGGETVIPLELEAKVKEIEKVFFKRQPKGDYMDDDTASIIEREVQRVIGHKDLGNVMEQLGKTIKSSADYVGLIEKGVEASLSGARGPGMNVRTPEEAVNTFKFLKGYVNRFVEIVSEKMGHPEYSSIGKEAANKVLERFVENLKPKYD